MTAPRYTEGTWKGIPQWRCGSCKFNTLDHGAMVNHARDNHPTEAELGGTVDDLERVPFASVKAGELARESKLGGLDFHGHEPTGASGFKTDDVRRIAASRTHQESDE